MQKKNLYTALSAALCFLASITAQAQPHTISLPAANIVAQSQYVQSVTNGTTGVLLLGGSVYVANAGGPYPAKPTSSLPALPLTVLNVQAISIGPVNLLNTVYDVVPEVTRKRIFSAGVSGGGTITSNYKINTNVINWQAGTYEGKLDYTADGLGNSVTPPQQTFTITVPEFISTLNPAIPVTTINVNNFSFYTSGISASSQVSYHTTVPTTLKLKATLPTLNYTSVPSGMANPNTAVGKITTALTGVVTGPQLPLSSTDATISPAAGLLVTSYTANNNLPEPTFSISAADLKTSFLKAGNYEADLTYTIGPLTGVTPAAITKTGLLRVTVASLAAFSVPPAAVSLAFNTSSNYKLGVSKNVPAQLTVSSTLPYNVTVRANTSTFVNGTNNLPLNLMTISGVNPADNITPLNLSTNPQNLISGASPVIARTYDLKYTVAPNSNLLSHAAGTYATTIVFTYVAP